MRNRKNKHESKKDESSRSIYDYMKLVFITFIIGILIVAFTFLAMVYKVPADKLIIDFSLGDGVISVIATLIGVMVTFVIGYQILNALEIKNEVRTIKREMQGAIKKLEVDFRDKNNFIEKKMEFELLRLDLKKAKESVTDFHDFALYIKEIVVFIEKTQKILNAKLCDSLSDERKSSFLDITNNWNWMESQVLKLREDHKEIIDDDGTPLGSNASFEVDYLQLMDEDNIKNRLEKCLKSESNFRVKERLKLIYDDLKKYNLLPDKKKEDR